MTSVVLCGGSYTRLRWFLKSTLIWYLYAINPKDHVRFGNDSVGYLTWNERTESIFNPKPYTLNTVSITTNNQNNNEYKSTSVCFCCLKFSTQVSKTASLWEETASSRGELSVVSFRLPVLHGSLCHAISLSFPAVWNPELYKLPDSQTRGRLSLDLEQAPQSSIITIGQVHTS